MKNDDFQLKGSTITVVVLELRSYDAVTFLGGLSAKVQKAPQLFQSSPLLINLEYYQSDELDFTTLIEQCRDQGFQPVGYKAVPDLLLASAVDTGLAVLPAGKDKGGDRKIQAEPQPSEQVNSEMKDNSVPEVVIQTVTEEKVVHKPAKVVTRPIRSGQQVYAEASDLIVLSQVSEGAEVLADGNIHVYGALRGRALAGVKGDTNARIFCQNLSAELISVAGNFLLNDAIDKKWQKCASQVYLSDDQLKIDGL